MLSAFGLGPAATFTAAVCTVHTAVGLTTSSIYAVIDAYDLLPQYRLRCVV
jgi:cytoplasmic iron level regulating protein YaaA (DUF328/UPF0246 family)